MSIPDFQSLMRPLLELHVDGLEHINRDLVNALAEQFALSADERREMLPSGRAKLFGNRVGWAKTYISDAKLIESPRRGISKITDEGFRALKAHDGPINVRFLNEFAGRKLLQEKKREVEAGLLISVVAPYLKIRTEVERSILQKILSNPPDFLERVIIDLVVKMGYGGNRKDAGEAIGRSGDEGIDGIIKEDLLGLDTIYLQAKRYEGTIGRPDIQKFAGALQGQRAKTELRILS